MLLDGVLELCPCGFDGIEVGVVGRQEHDPSAFGLDHGACFEVLVSAEIVENDDMTWPKMRAQQVLNERGKDPCGGSTLHCHRGQQTAQTQRSDDRVQPTSLYRLGFIQPPSTRRLPVVRSHRGVGTRFVDEDEVFGRHAFDGLEVDLSQSFDAVGVSFGGYKRLFLRV